MLGIRITRCWAPDSHVELGNGPTRPAKCRHRPVCIIGLHWSRGEIPEVEYDTYGNTYTTGNELQRSSRLQATWPEQWVFMSHVPAYAGIDPCVLLGLRESRWLVKR